VVAVEQRAAPLLQEERLERGADPVDPVIGERRREVFVFLDMLPVLVKYLSGDSSYDRMLTSASNSAVKIHGEQVRLAERRAMADLEIAQDTIEQEVRRHRAESEAASREHAAAMNIRVRQAVSALEDEIRRSAKV
jgi:hypothetical protein